MEEEKLNSGNISTGSSPNFRKIVILAGIALAMILKNIYYYSLMGVNTGFALSAAVTILTTALIFGIFKRKWIPGVIYLIFSMIMAADVNYYSFFNRNLSVKALGAADMLGGVTESIKDIFMPESLLLLADALLILVLSIVFRKKILEESECRFCSVMKKTGTRIVFAVLSVLMLVSLVVIVPEEDSAAGAVVSQEFFAYHLRDVTGINAPEAEKIDMKDILAVSGNYENEKKGADFGCGEGRNLIVIQVEAMQNFVINNTYNGQEITPFINSLLKEDTFYFDSYYQQTGSGNTSDAEFATNNSIFGSMQSYTYKIFQDNYWNGLPVLLKDRGYSTVAFHAYEGDYWNRENAYPGQGFDEFYSQDDYDITETLGMGLSDSEFFSQSFEILEDFSQPFYGFFVTLSSHHPFAVKGDLKLSKDDEDTLFGNYLQSMNYVDSCLEELFGYLKESGLYEDTIVAFYGDHLGMNPKTPDVQKRMSEYLGWDYSYEDAMNIPLVIHVPGSGEGKTIDVVGGQTDFLPTIAYLMGFESLDTIYFGHNLCTVKSNFVPVRSYVSQGSFITGDIMFKMAKSGLMSDAEAVNIRTHEKLSPDMYSQYYAKAVQLQNTSDYYLEKDILREVLVKGRTLESLVSGAKQGGYYSIIEVQPVIEDAAAGEGQRDGLYCLENFDRMYEEGTRAFALNLIWTADGHTAVMHDWGELEKYFRRYERINSYDTLERAMEYNSIEGITAMTGSGFIEWALAHEDALFYISIDDEDLLGGEAEIERVYFARTLKSSYPELLDRIIFVAKDIVSLDDYNSEGLYNVIFYAGEKYTADNIADLCERYEMYGTAVNIEDAAELKEIWKKEEHVIYGYTDSYKDIEKAEELGLSGVVIIPASVI
ncbi:MAG: sulfatase-like hydrolase/transferase [Bacillota bacterium]|nr:sulfatase-like hydrolase/transferase [Bacillota bacterium]